VDVGVEDGVAAGVAVRALADGVASRIEGVGAAGDEDGWLVGDGELVHAAPTVAIAMMSANTNLDLSPG
jgi:hypothetical protein